MILLREVQEKDLDALERLAQIPGFINLPPDRDLLHERIVKSTKSFRDELSNKTDTKFLFVAEDLKTQQILGTSMIASQHGTADSPHFYFEVGSEERVSETISTGFIHGTLKLRYDTNGPSEIGGLVIDREARNLQERIGRQISFVRFLFLGLNRNRFKRKLLAELLPPLNKKGQSPLWEAIGRRFTNMDYWEADQLCQKNKEFIFSLFPSGKIYTTFLPAEARNAIGKVGRETEPVVHMLEKVGFEYKNQVDPFDGGPHFWANVEDLTPLKKMVLSTYDPTLPTTGVVVSGLLCLAAQKQGSFRAIHVQVIQDGEKKINFADSAVGSGFPSSNDACQILGLKPGESVVFMPYY